MLCMAERLYSVKSGVFEIQNVNGRLLLKCQTVFETHAPAHALHVSLWHLLNIVWMLFQLHVLNFHHTVDQHDLNFFQVLFHKNYIIFSVFE